MTEEGVEGDSEKTKDAPREPRSAPNNARFPSEEDWDGSCGGEVER